MVLLNFIRNHGIKIIKNNQGHVMFCWLQHDLVLVCYNLNTCTNTNSNESYIYTLSYK